MGDGGGTMRPRSIYHLQHMVYNFETYISVKYTVLTMTADYNTLVI